MKNIPYGHQHIDSKDIREVVRVLKSDWLTQGPKVKEFEDALCHVTGARFAVAVSSGTAALHIACLAAGLCSGDEVITSPNTFVASANCVLYCGAKPVFADVIEETGNIDPVEVEKKITTKTKAIIAVHFAGHPCDIMRIGNIAKERNLLLIEDACHALGARYDGERVGSCRHSLMCVFSFHPVKPITTGEGGAVTTNNRVLYERLLILRNHGITRERRLMSRFDGPWYYEMQHLGFNYRLTDFQSALGLSQIKKLSYFLKERSRIAAFYARHLSGIRGISLPFELDGCRSSWHLYPVRLKGERQRRKVFVYLRKRGVGVQVHYIPLHLQPYYRKQLGYRRGDFPRAEHYYARTLSLPIYVGLTEKELLRIVRLVTDCVCNG